MKKILSKALPYFSMFMLGMLSGSMLGRCHFSGVYKDTFAEGQKEEHCFHLGGKLKDGQCLNAQGMVIMQ